MAQRHVCPSMGSIWRPIARDASMLSRCSSRSLHRSARLLADSSDSGSSPSSSDQYRAASRDEPARETRRSRNSIASRSILNLRSNSQRGPKYQTIGEAMGAKPGSDNASASSAPVGRTGPLIQRAPVGGRPPPGPMVRGPPTGTMARGPRVPGTIARSPAGLRIIRQGGPPARTSGPNLSARDRPAGNKQTGEAAPKRRERKSAAQGASKGAGKRGEDVKIEDTLSDAMVQHLLRLQRKEWDRVPYRPKYGQGSRAASELLEAGKRLFEGEVKVKSEPGPLEKKLRIANMHGA